jgi:chemotaxis protein MotB
MGKKVKHPEHENLERWLVSYADFITLLFATFTALFAIAQSQLTNAKAVADAIKQSFQQQSLLGGIQSLFEGTSSSADTTSMIQTQTGMGEGVVGAYESLTPNRGTKQEAQETLDDVEALANSINALTEELNEELAQALAVGANSSASGLAANEFEGEALRGVTVTQQERGLRVSLDSRLLFAAGSATLLPASQKAMVAIVQRLRPYAQQHLIQVEGHTDSQGFSSPQFPSNWELSTARAAVVVRQLITGGLPAQHLVAAGYAATRPVASNATPQGRALNRRIDIMLYNEVAGPLTDPGSQFSKEKPYLAPPEAKASLAERAASLKAQQPQVAPRTNLADKPLEAVLLRVESSD